MDSSFNHDPTKNGWLGLVFANGHWELARARIRIEGGSSSTDSYDGYEKIMITSSLRDSPDDFPFLYCPTLSPGRVDTASVLIHGRKVKLDRNALLNQNFQLNRDSRVNRNSRLQIRFHGRRYDLVLIAGGNVVIRGDGKQSIFGTLEAQDASARLIWAGDIDRDGALDLLVEFEDQDGGGDCLLTSGGATGRELVHQAGCEMIAG